MSRQKNEQEQADWQRERRINRRSTLVSFVAIAAFVLISLPFIKSVKSPIEVQDNIEKSMKVAPLTLSAYYLDHGKDVPLDIAHVDVDRDIVFSLSSIRPVHISLVASVDDAEPTVLFHGAKIPPGPHRIIERHDKRYVFQMKPGQHHVKTCLITASDSEYLQKKIDRDLSQEWQMAKQDACVTLVASN